MLVISYGITKSGSTLAFEMSKAVFALCGHAQPRLRDGLVDAGHPVNFIDDFTLQRLETLMPIFGDGPHIVVKTHSALSPEVAQAAERYMRDDRLRVHTVFRDPRDICLSMLDNGKLARSIGIDPFSEIVTLDDAIAACRRQAPALERWSALEGAQRFSFDELAFDQDRAIARMNDHIGMNAEPAQVRLVLRFAFTEKNKGVRDRHKSELSAQDGQRILAALPPGIRPDFTDEGAGEPAGAAHAPPA